MGRTYDDPCGVARALDAVGERWALLVVRELLLGPKRFADLRRGLPGASQSVLSQRLDELEATGVVHRRALGPPARAQVYELTGRGRELEPVVVALAAWGSRQTLTSTADLSPDALALAMRTTFDASAARGLRGAFELHIDEEVCTAFVGDGFTVTGGGTTTPDAVLTTSAAVLRGLIFGGRDLGDACACGEARVRGDHRALARLLGSFPRPAPAASPPA